MFSTLWHSEATIPWVSPGCSGPQYLQVQNECIDWWAGEMIRREGRRERASADLSHLGFPVNPCESQTLPLSPSEGATEEEKLLSRKMMRYWANFARTG